MTHPHNGPALAILEELIRQKHLGFVSAGSLTEFYSVLTRTPFKPPIHPSEAGKIIEDMVLLRMQLVTLTAKEYQDAVRDCAANGWAGGKIHDAGQPHCLSSRNKRSPRFASAIPIAIRRRHLRCAQRRIAIAFIPSISKTSGHSPRLTYQPGSPPHETPKIST
jgi:hypothetical protein